MTRSEGPEESTSASPAALAGKAVAPVLFLPRLLVGMLGDIRSIAESTRVIAGLAENLERIDRRMESMDSEVSAMRQGVDSLNPEITAMRRAVEPLDEQLAAVRSLARIASRLPGGGGRAARRAAAELEAEAAALEAEAEELEAAEAAAIAEEREAS